ncbi:hypothetical protein [Pseudomonas syringae group genomosp. 3]|uniref:hypothetical protein n=1 Tax=Pseudomonas syringae group genomosp. 3 TaxID=251701 RepID=UPI00069260A3|nr:hypothetical protein [Pseudomonas syringae group genomosp. 3]
MSDCKNRLLGVRQLVSTISHQLHAVGQGAVCLGGIVEGLCAECGRERARDTSSNATKRLHLPFEALDLSGSGPGVLSCAINRIASSINNRSSSQAGIVQRLKGSAKIVDFLLGAAAVYLNR